MQDSSTLPPSSTPVLPPASSCTWENVQVPGWMGSLGKGKERKRKSLSCVRLFETLRTVAYQALPSMGFSRQEYWSGLPFPSPGDLPGSSIHGIFQARILEWVAISFFRGSSQPRDWTQVSHIVGRRFTIWATKEVLGEGEEHLFKSMLCLPYPLPLFFVGCAERIQRVMSDSLQPRGL